MGFHGRFYLKKSFFFEKISELKKILVLKKDLKSVKSNPIKNIFTEETFKKNLNKYVKKLIVSFLHIFK